MANRKNVKILAKKNWQTNKTKKTGNGKSAKKTNKTAIKKKLAKNWRAKLANFPR